MLKRIFLRVVSIFVISLNHFAFSQTNLDTLFTEFQEINKRILIIAEEHFVGQKHEELEKIILGFHAHFPNDKINLVFELPKSSEYILEKLRTTNDSASFEGYFDHLYSGKSKTPSLFWLDFKKLIYTVSRSIPEDKLQFHCIDFERRYRKTAYCINQYLIDQYDMISQPLDSLLRQETIRDDSINQQCLESVLNSFLETKNDSFLLDVLKALSIESGFTQSRGTFLSDQFCALSKNEEYIIGNFGLLHVFDTVDLYKDNPKYHTYVLDKNGNPHNPFLFQSCNNSFDDTYVIGLMALKKARSHEDKFQIETDRGMFFSEAQTNLLQQLSSFGYRSCFSTSRYPDLNTLPLNYIILYQWSNYRDFIQK